jgi:hypothetical protein
MIERNVCLGGHAVQVQGETKPVEHILSFMFDDIPAEKFEQVEAKFTLKPLDNEWQVLKGDKQIYKKDSLTDAANYLMGEVVYHLIENNQKYMAVHAALLSDERGGILLPGESGNGKTSLSIWMTKNGYHYHTDELVLIKPGSLQTRVFTRPFNIKSHGIEAISRLIDIDKLQPAASRGDFITMIPHRALNPEFINQPPEISRILFPKYGKDGENKLTPLTPAAAGIELMKTHVIARNLPGHGFEQLLDIVKSVPAYKLNYNHFDVLPELLSGLKETRK